MAVRVGINGFGRIGRNYLRAVLEQGADVEVVAANDLAPPASNAHLLKYDSTFGSSSRKSRSPRTRSRSARTASRSSPRGTPRPCLGESSASTWSSSRPGIFTDGDKARAHIEAGAKRVIISAPATNVDATFVVGVNDDTFDPAKHRVISNASCTTNCFVPMIKVLDDAFGVEKGLMTTVHAYTNDQNLLDLVHKDLRRARAAADQHRALEHRRRPGHQPGAGQHEGPPRRHRRCGCPSRTVRSPTSPASWPARSPWPRSTTPSRPPPRPGTLAKVLVYTEDPIVSSDIVGSPASCTFDSKLTMVIGSMVKVFGWYDNEWGYSNRLVDLALIAGRA